MNTKQLVVACIMGASILLSYAFMPYYVFFKKPIHRVGTEIVYTRTLHIPVQMPKIEEDGYKTGVFIKKYTKAQEKRDFSLIMKRFFNRVFSILIIGSLLIYTLKDKKYMRANVEPQESDRKKKIKWMISRWELIIPVGLVISLFILITLILVFFLARIHTSQNKETLTTEELFGIKQ